MVNAGGEKCKKSRRKELCREKDVGQGGGVPLHTRKSKFGGANVNESYCEHAKTA